MNHNIQACALLVLVGAQGHGCSIAPNSPAPQECLLAFMQP